MITIIVAFELEFNLFDKAKASSWLAKFSFTGTRGNS